MTDLEHDLVKMVDAQMKMKEEQKAQDMAKEQRFHDLEKRIYDLEQIRWDMDRKITELEADKNAYRAHLWALGVEMKKLQEWKDNFDAIDTLIATGGTHEP